MLVIIYLASVVAGVLAFVFEEIEEYKKSVISTSVSIFSGIIYIIPTASKISQNLSEPSFRHVFGIISLFFLLVAFLSGDIENILSYGFTAFITSLLFCFFCSSFNYSNYLVNCYENHDYVETIQIATTVNSIEYSYYEYFFQDKNGNIQSNKIRYNRTTITYIDEGITPYVEIKHDVDCMGFRNKSKTHVIRGSSRTYNLHIPKGSIKNITPTS